MIFIASSGVPILGLDAAEQFAVAQPRFDSLSFAHVGGLAHETAGFLIECNGIPARQHVIRAKQPQSRLEHLRAVALVFDPAPHNFVQKLDRSDQHLAANLQMMGWTNPE